ncbi:hypothetical protein PUN28_005207 [Cardiocondyla obscurior]|uniref:Uncharacterized protein n=1 Tax=Cardiocondyla obscurior TaxID=286306 RepID=A0AAW2GJV1_9HYME
MLAFIVRGVFLVSVLSWYSAIVWKVIDSYFQDQFRAYLQEEYRKHPRIKADVESAVAVYKESPSALPVESSLSPGVAEICDSSVGRPADIANAYPGAIVSAVKPAEPVAGGTSEIAAAVGVGATDRETFPADDATRLTQESRETPSDRRDKKQWTGAINQDNNREGDTAEDGALPSPTFARRVEKSQRRLGKRKLSRPSKEVSGEMSREKPRNRRVNTLVLIDADFAAAKTGDNDFSEFEDEEEDSSGKEGVLVSQLPFQPKADIGGLDRVTADEFCPLTLEDEASCGEITTWP